MHRYSLANECAIWSVSFTRNHLIEIRSPVLQAISQLILEIGPTAAAGGGEEKIGVISSKKIEIVTIQRT